MAGIGKGASEAEKTTGPADAMLDGALGTAGAAEKTTGPADAMLDGALGTAGAAGKAMAPAAGTATGGADGRKGAAEIVRYLVAGVLTTIVCLAVKWGLLFTVLCASDPFQLQVAVVASWVCAVAFAYVINRIYVFRSGNGNVLRELAGFVGSRVGTLLVEAAIMWFMVTAMGLDSDTWVVIATLVCQVVVTVLNYVLSKLVVFKPASSDKE